MINALNAANISSEIYVPPFVTPIAQFEQPVVAILLYAVLDLLLKDKAKYACLGLGIVLFFEQPVGSFIVKFVIP